MRVSITADGPVEAGVDRLRLNQTISNLLTNAAKFSSTDAPIEVTVTADGQLVYISVRDHGPGIAEHHRTELSDASPGSGSDTRGMGIGPVPRRSIVEAHGCVIGYDDARGDGAVFTIKFPKGPPSQLTVSAGGLNLLLLLVSPTPRRPART